MTFQINAVDQVEPTSITWTIPAVSQNHNGQALNAGTAIVTLAFDAMTTTEAQALLSSSHFNLPVNVTMLDRLQLTTQTFNGVYFQSIPNITQEDIHVNGFTLTLLGVSY